MSKADTEALRKNPDSSIVFIDDHFSTSIINILLQTPYEYSFNGMTGLKYEAVKDFIRWATPSEYDEEEVQKRFVPMLLGLGSYMAHQLNSNK